MMIKKIIRVENLGCLRRLSWGTGVGEVENLVGVFAENGAGKTTLVAALRAARDGIDEPLQERRSLPKQGSPGVELLSSGGVVSYRGGSWSGDLASVEVFDSAFVAANVYDGRQVGPDQRAQLYRMSLGSAEVEAATAVDEAKGKLAEARKPRKGIEKRLRKRCEEIGLTFEKLRDVEPISEPPPDFVATKARLTALETRQDLDGLPNIVPLPAVPALDGDGLKQLLNRTAVSLSEEAMEVVRSHIADHLDADGEAWLRQGTRYTQQRGDCPYCGQSLTTSPLAELFPRFFDDSYRHLQRRIERGVARLRTWDDWVASLRRIERSNQQAARTWSALVGVEDPPEVVDVPERAEALVETLRSLIGDKQAHLLDPLGSDPRVEAVLDAHRELLEPIAGYNTWANEAARICRDLLANHLGEVQKLRGVVRRTQAQLLRGSPSVKEEIVALEDATKTCNNLQALLEAAEATLKRREGERTATFLARVNEVLAEFGAGFRIRDLEGKSSPTRVIADFQIALMDGIVERQGARVKASGARKLEPRFDTVLSKGDRTTLALAVFFARCIEAPDAERIVVLDDPLTSLDRARRTMTRHYIKKLGDQCAQVWLLSHDELFLRAALPRNASFLTIRHRSNDCVLESWDVEAACKTKHARDLDRLELFAASAEGAPTPDDARRMVRTVLEGYLRFRFRRAWRPNEWLRDFISKGRAGDPNIPLTSDQIERIATWCGFSNPGMHDDPSDVSPPLSAAETRTQVASVLEFVHG